VKDYAASAREDAKETVLEFIDDIVEQLNEVDDVSDDLYNDYPDGDSWHNECHVDKAYSLQEAADLLQQLSDHEEDDYGLWAGLKPVQAISCQAAYTYGNAVYSTWRELIKLINDEYSALEADELDGIDLDDAVRSWISEDL